VGDGMAGMVRNQPVAPEWYEKGASAVPRGASEPSPNCGIPRIRGTFVDWRTLPALPYKQEVPGSSPGPPIATNARHGGGAFVPHAVPTVTRVTCVEACWKRTAPETAVGANVRCSG
jgi:hypothetical protein